MGDPKSFRHAREGSSAHDQAVPAVSQDPAATPGLTRIVRKPTMPPKGSREGDRTRIVWDQNPDSTPEQPVIHIGAARLPFFPAT